jgi:hypothetical protein
MTTVETQRLVLRPWAEEDRIELERLFADPAVRGERNLPPDRIARLAEHSTWQWRANGFGPSAALEKASRRWIGRIGLDVLEDWSDVHKIEVGIRVARRVVGTGPGHGGSAAGAPLRLRAAPARARSQRHGRGPHGRTPGDGEGRAQLRRNADWMNPEVPVVWCAVDRVAWKQEPLRRMRPALADRGDSSER